MGQGKARAPGVDAARPNFFLHQSSSQLPAFLTLDTPKPKPNANFLSWLSGFVSLARRMNVSTFLALVEVWFRNEKMCLQEDELSTLRKKLELQSFSTEACNRGLKSLGDLLAETKNLGSQFGSLGFELCRV